MEKGLGVKQQAPRPKSEGLLIPSWTGLLVARYRDLAHRTQHRSGNREIACDRDHDRGQRNGGGDNGRTDGSQRQPDVSQLLKEGGRGGDSPFNQIHNDLIL